MNDRRGVTVIKAHDFGGSLYAEFEIQLSAGNTADIRTYSLNLRGAINCSLKRNDELLISGEDFVVRLRLQAELNSSYSLHHWNVNEFIAYLYGWNDGYQLAVARSM